MSQNVIYPVSVNHYMLMSFCLLDITRKCFKQKVREKGGTTMQLNINKSEQIALLVLKGEVEPKNGHSVEEYIPTAGMAFAKQALEKMLAGEEWDGSLIQMFPAGFLRGNKWIKYQLDEIFECRKPDELFEAFKESMGQLLECPILTETRYGYEWWFGWKRAS